MFSKVSLYTNILSDMLPVVFKKSNKKYVIQVLLLLIHFKCKYTEQICNKFKTR